MRGTSKVIIPVPVIDLKSLAEFAEPVQGLQIGGTGNREKTNPCGAVKPEITQKRQGADICPANRFFNDLSLSSKRNETGRPRAL
jgi:hypothetical protein